MTTPLVRPEEVAEWVFSTQPENDPQLEAIASLATGVVLDYVGPDPLTGLARTWTEATVPDPVRVAILMVVADLWTHRGDAAPPEGPEGAMNGHLPPAAARYVQRYRDPVVS